MRVCLLGVSCGAMVSSFVAVSVPRLVSVLGGYSLIVRVCLLGVSCGAMVSSSRVRLLQ